jgi:hypothetical protein
LISGLESLGIDQEQLEELRGSGEVLRNGAGAINAARVEAEYQRVLRQVDQLELLLSDNATVSSDGIEAQVRQGEVSGAAAEYYRRLSEQPLRLQR